MTGQELYERMLHERFGICIESDADAWELDELLTGFCSRSIHEKYKRSGVLSIVASKSDTFRILFAITDCYEDCLRRFCRELLPSSMFVGKPIEIETIDGLL